MASAEQKLTVELTLTIRKKTAIAKQRAKKIIMKDNTEYVVPDCERFFRQILQYYLIIMFDKLLLLLLFGVCVCLARRVHGIFSSALSLSQFIDLLQLNLYCVFSCVFPPRLPFVYFQQSMFLFHVQMLLLLLLLFLYIFLAHTFFESCFVIRLR